MINLKLFAGVGAALVLGSCGLLSTESRSVAIAQSPTPRQDNLIGLFIVKRNNLNQQYRGEIYPIVQYKNGRYSDASLDVTLQMRQDAKEADIVKRNAAKSVLNSNPTFTAVNAQGNSLGKFSIDRLGVSQFACSSLLIGRGKLLGQSNVQTMFNQLPRDRERQLSGFFNGQEFDETWRSTLAAQSVPSTVTPVRSTPVQRQQYRKDLIQIGTREIAKNPQAKSVQGSVALMDMQVFDLDRDGKPEVYGKLRKAPARPVTPSNRATVQSIYANVWLGYTAPQPKILASQVVPYFVPTSEVSRAYEVLGAIDANGDGKQEVLIQNNGYESINFSVYELQGNQLKPVFTGAGYGC
ncbi:hypothetical protein [Leptolyngbya sp. FACHB-17]|uniref:hypothetical protein n=1 Tax=unclassified Leptolyngbya TaxID=2650499 RepID=UPI0016810D86|nr:hypothetical protein [Leptolyngbya sp. FACHB-17]MBD2081390.1 hypothetical protein [Leptolyngbya sp. FACHB-17]